MAVYFPEDLDGMIFENKIREEIHKLAELTSVKAK